jgi:hypothetical protein
MSTNYTCKRCGFETHLKHALKGHLQRKHACSPVDEDSNIDREQLINELYHRDYREHCSECPFCSKKFNNRSSMYRHKSICKLKKEAKGVDSSTYARLKAEIIAEIQGQLHQHVVTNTTNTNTNTNCNNNTTHNTYVINAYDRPNLDYLTPRFLTQCVKRRDKGLCELLEQIHYHPEHAENHNVRVSNKKLSLIETHDGERFQYQQKDKVLDELVREGFEILENHYLENEEEVQRALNYNETRLEEVREFLEACRDQDIHVLAPLKQNVYLLILNRQYIVFQKRQQQQEQEQPSASS